MVRGSSGHHRCACQDQVLAGLHVAALEAPNQHLARCVELLRWELDLSLCQIAEDCVACFQMMCWFLTRWGPLVASWMRKPFNYGYIYHGWYPTRWAP